MCSPSGAGLLLGLATLSLLAAGLPASSAAQTSARDTLPVISEVRIEGNRGFPDDQIKRAIATRESGCKSFLLAPFCVLGLDAFRRIERLDPRELRTDVARIRVFYYRRGYRKAEVDTALARSGSQVRITFHVVEGEPIVVRAMEIRGLDEVQGAERVGQNLPLREGEPFSEVALNASRERIERQLGNRGYPDATVLVQSSIPATDTLGAHVILDVVPGSRARIGEITVEGIDELDTAEVRRFLTFKTGDLFRQDEIVRSQRKLYSMALFNYVDIRRADVGADSILGVNVRVSEADMHDVRVGLGLSTTECGELEAGWTHRNFLGGTRRLELSGILSNVATAELARQFPCSQAGVAKEEDALGTDPFNKVTWRLRADFQQPWFLDTENWLNVGVFSERQSLPPIYARLSYGGDLRFTREISSRTGLSLTYRAGRDSLEEGSADILFCANFGVCRPDDIQTLSQTRWLSWTALNVTRNTTDVVFNPSRGYRISVEAEHASRLTGSDWAYSSAEAEVAWYRRVGAAVLALRIRGGLVEPIGSGLEGDRLTEGGEDVSHPLKRQYAGGAYSVRGYSQNLLGPKILLADSASLADTARAGFCDPADITDENTWVCDPAGLDSDNVFPRPVGGERGVVGNIELRLPFSSRWSGVAFVDIGKIWTPGGGVGGANEEAWSPGIGFRYASPVGPVRLDIGYNTGGIERLPVVTQVFHGGEEVIVQTVGEDGRANRFAYDPFSDGSAFQELVSRLQLHISIGQAF